MFNIILLIIGFFLTKKDKNSDGGNSTASSSGGGISSGTWDKIVVGGVVALLYVQLKKSIDASSRQTALEDAPNNPYTQQALALRQACNTSGNDWAIDYDGTDEDAILALAPHIGRAGWGGVQTSYQQLYAESLTERLTKELGNADFQKFLLLLGAGSTGGSTGSTTPTPTTPTVLNPDKYQVPGKPSVSGKIVKVLRGKTIYHTNVNPTRVFAAGTSLGAAKGWVMQSGKLMLVYEYSPGLFSKNEIHYADPYSVYLV